MNINWYPGHMKKTKELITENLKIIDLVIEILDARIPFSSKNPDILKLAKNKQKITVLNKVDLVDSKELKKWQDYFLENNISDYFVALSVEKGTNFNELRKITDKIYADKLEKMKKKGLRKTEVRAMIVGIPNVGKSKFINKFVNKNKARVGNTPGFTKGKQWIKIDDKLELLDTPGVLWPKFEDDDVALKLALTGAIKDQLLPMDEVTIFGLEYFKSHYPKELQERYKQMDLEQEAPGIIMEMTQRLGFRDDYDRFYSLFVKDVRDGRLGRYTLDRVGEVDAND